MAQLTRATQTDVLKIPNAGKIGYGVTAAGDPVQLLANTDGATVGGAIAGEDGAVMRVRERTTPYILSVTTAVGIGAGASGDTVLEGILILANATAVTATLIGFGDQAGVATNIVLTGSTSQDVWYPLRWLNTVGAMTVTASVANKVVVSWTAK